MELYKTKLTLNIRSTPEVTASNDVGDIPAEAMYTISEKYLNWGKVIEIISRDGIKIPLPAPVCWVSVKPEYAVNFPFTFPDSGGKVYPSEIRFNISFSEGYDPAEVVCTPK